MFSATHNKSEVQTDGHDIFHSENFEVQKCKESFDLEKDEDVLNNIRGVFEKYRDCMLCTNNTCNSDKSFVF